VGEEEGDDVTDPGLESLIDRVVRKAVREEVASALASRLMSQQEAAAYLSVSVRTLTTWRQIGRICGERHGRQWRSARGLGRAKETSS
jgi:excisionase family DNA binding protein